MKRTHEIQILNNKANQIGPVTIWKHSRTGGKYYDHSFERFMILISIALILFITGFFVWF
ncbi:MAG TPA: hypothetical protein VKY57_02805 [Chitinispirillaceae bacterium]|nr:hypothetical protein [Chitinispirillaceae bacterium]